MRIGLSERDAGIADLVDGTRVADDLGFDYLTCSEHVAVSSTGSRGRRTLDGNPLARELLSAGVAGCAPGGRQ